MHLILTTNFSPWSAYSGGGQRSTHNLATALAGRGHEVEVIFTRPPWEEVEVPGDLPYAVHWAILPALRTRRNAPLRPLSALSVAARARKLARRETVIHSSGEEGAAVPLFCAEQPFVMTARYPAYPLLLKQRTRTPLENTRLLLTETKFVMLGYALHRAGRVCTTSMSAAREVREAYGPALPVEVVPNGVTPAFLGAKWREPGPDAPVVFFGRLARSKGIDTLIEALASMDQPPPCVVVGRGDMEERIAREIRTRGLHDRLEMRGWMEPDQLAALLSRAALAVLPSREESFGNAMAEAMTVGTPLVSTTAGSIPEVVRDGETGLLVPPGDPDRLAEAMRSLMEDRERAAALGRTGRRLVRDRFTWSAVAARYEQIYDDLLRRR